MLRLIIIGLTVGAGVGLLLGGTCVCLGDGVGEGRGGKRGGHGGDGDHKTPPSVSCRAWSSQPMLPRRVTV